MLECGAMKRYPLLGGAHLLQQAVHAGKQLCTLWLHQKSAAQKQQRLLVFTKLGKNFAGASAQSTGRVIITGESSDEIGQKLSQTQFGSSHLCQTFHLGQRQVVGHIVLQEQRRDLQSRDVVLLLFFVDVSQTRNQVPTLVRALSCFQSEQ